MEIVEFIKKGILESKEKGLIPLIVIMGPTASGKTDLSLALARHFDAEIVSADSRQIYREMNIGTAKTTQSQQQEIKHYLIDIISPNQKYSLADYQLQAKNALLEIAGKNKIPMLVGGTGLYISSITSAYQLPHAPPNPTLRADLEKMAQEQSKESVHNLLKELDPQKAAEISPQNLRYVIRAIEIIKSGNQPQKTDSPFYPIYLQPDWSRDQLYERINLRIDQQISQGLIEETKYLLKKYPADLPALTSLGYQEISSYLNGEMSLDQAIELFKQHTRNFAKRQLTWFRKFHPVYLIPGNTLSQIIQQLNER